MSISAVATGIESYIRQSGLPPVSRRLSADAPVRSEAYEAAAAPDEDAAIVRVGTAAAASAQIPTYTARASLAEPRPRRTFEPERPLRPALQPYEPADERVARDLEELVGELRTLDADVRRHEMTHKKELGPYAAGGIEYQLSYGPDALLYATGGRVPVDLSPAATPQETLEKANTIERAALAVDNPSRADLDVAAKAGRMARAANEQLSLVA